MGGDTGAVSLGPWLVEMETNDYIELFADADNAAEKLRNKKGVLDQILEGGENGHEIRLSRAGS